MTEALASSPGSADRRARRKAETRARLLAAARRLFVERGYHATRPQDVARAADLGAGTFYVHFADKREAFLAFSEQAAEELMARVRRATEGEPDFAHRLRRALEALLAYADDHPGVLRAAFADAEVIAAELPREASLRERLASSLAGALREGMRAGRLRDDLDAEVVAHGVVGFVHHAVAHGTARGLDREVLLDTVTRFCARPLARGPEDPR
ncbi:MAG: TetR family transcriptional regulator [Myxococcota bacterium]|nr:TetR family transcriptional regulator [Myxococcota bacterium]